MGEKAKLEPLVPPDREQCQAEVPNGHAFMTLGGIPGRVRCPNPAVYIATENQPGEDGRKGSMSLCSRCLTVMQRQLGLNYATIEALPDKVLSVGEDRAALAPAGHPAGRREPS